MTTTGPFEHVLAARAADRLARAARLADHALADLRAGRFEARIIGSLAAGRFRLHSDIDVLVSGPIDPTRRVAAERTMAAVMRGTGIPYDLIFTHDLTPAQAAAFEADA